MKQELYIQERLEDQIDWYDKKSIKAQKNYKVIRIIEICLTASIPVLIGILSISPEIIKVIIAVFGATVTVLSGLSMLNKFHENWITYRGVCETLRQEKYLFETSSGPYSNTDTAYQTLVIRCEQIISFETSNWCEIQSKNIKE